MSKYLVLFGFIFLSGCLTRTYTITTPRVDTEVRGNRGYLSGTPPETSVSPSRLGDVRKTSVLEVELGAHRRKIIPRKTENAATVIEEPAAPVEVSEETAPQASDEIVEEKVYEEYIVEKGDTLQKISQKFYGTTRKWQMLYDENKDVLKGPDKVYPGMKIRVPKK
jgi:LysM repeat protein